MSYRALIIEDSPEFAELLCRILDRLEHEGIVVTNQQDARYRIDEGDFDFVLLDLSLPTHKDDTNPLPSVGTDLLAHIRDRFDERDLPVIMMTAYEKSSQTGVQLMKSGANDYFSKVDSTTSAEQKILAVAKHLDDREREEAIPSSTIPDRPSDGKDSIRSEASRQPKKRYELILKRNQGDARFQVKVADIDIPTGRKRWVDLLLLLSRESLKQDRCLGMTAKEIASEFKVRSATVHRWVNDLRRFLEKQSSSADDHGKIILNLRDGGGYRIDTDRYKIERERDH